LEKVKTRYVLIILIARKIRKGRKKPEEFLVIFPKIIFANTGRTVKKSIKAKGDQKYTNLKTYKR